MTNPINLALEELLTQTNAEGAIIVSADGLSIASELRSSRNEEKIAAMSGSILSIGEQFATELDKGHLDQLYIKSDIGYILFKSISNFAVLGLIVPNDIRLGLLFLHMKNTSEQIQSMM